MALLGTPQLKSGSTSFGVDKDLNRTCERTYRCYFDAIDSDVYVSNNLPPGIALRSVDPDYAGYVVVDLKVSDMGEVTDPNSGAVLARQWDATVQYGPWTSLLSSPDGNPLNQPVRPRIQSTRVDRPFESDAQTGQPILNTVGDPFDPPPVMDFTTSIIVVERNEASPAIAAILDNVDGWQDHVNDDWWNGFPPRSVKVSPINLPERKYHQLCGLYYPMEYQFELRFPNWDRVFANQGYRQFDPNSSTPKLQDIAVEGSPIGEPAFLDEDGHYLPPPVDKDDLVNLTYQSYKTMDFGVLNMNNLFAGAIDPTAPPGTGGGFSSSDGGGFAG